MDFAAELPPHLRVALAWQPKKTRPALGAILAFDNRLARIVTQAREPMLAQVRLAWWRERLSEPVAARTGGEPLLEAFGRMGAIQHEALVVLVDAWENLLGEADWSRDVWTGLVDARGNALANLELADGADAEAVQKAAARWALADLAERASDASVRNEIADAGRALAPPRRLARESRGVAVLDALAARALARDEPLFAGRGAALVALRVGMFGG